MAGPQQQFDVAVIGAGSGGIGAAVAAARLGLSVALVEKADTVGGNAARCGVNCWEMGAGGTGIPFDIYRRLKRIPNAVGIYSQGRHVCFDDRNDPPFPGGENVIDRGRRYIDSLQRHGTKGLRADKDKIIELWHGVPFEPDAYATVVEDMLAATGNCTLLKKTAFESIDHAGGRIRSITLDNGSTIAADVYVDGTADALLAIACGVETVRGQESRDTYGEVGAPEQATNFINAVTLIYRVTRKPHGKAHDVDPLPEGMPQDECWWASRFPMACVNEYPCGDRNFNMLPTMQGRDFLAMPYPDAYAECKRRALAHWAWVQREFPEWRAYEICWFAPGLGVRESQRIIGEYVLTEHDLVAGLSGQTHDDIICIADHAMDTHGEGNRRGGCGELEQPYGVPFRCLIPKAFRNLLVACRGSSFSSIGASSCRLSRTMMQLGQAAGTAASIAKSHGVDVCEAPARPLRDALRAQHVQLEHPMTDAMRAYLADEDAT